jgi:biotin-(acetyl-CoA carboxylase) ligase
MHLDLNSIPRQIERLRHAGHLTLITRAQTLPACGSTQDECFTRSQGTPGLLVTTYHQHAGRGRLGRTWQHEESLGLAATFSLDAARFDASTISLACGVAAALACERALARSPTATSPATHTATTPARPSIAIKWPNDIVERTPIGTTPRKLAGVLVERRDNLLLAGIGINIAQRDEDFHGSVRAIACSLARLGARARRDLTLLDLAVALDHALRLTREQLLHAWRSRDIVTGRTCTIAHDTHHYEGTVQSLDPTGDIVLVTSANTLRRLPAHQSTLVPGTLR